MLSWVSFFVHISMLGVRTRMLHFALLQLVLVGVPRDTVDANEVAGPPPLEIVRLVIPSDPQDEHFRARYLLGLDSGAPTLLRSTTSSTGHQPAAAGNSVVLLGPRLRTVWNSDLPFSMNQAGLWAGRGVSTQLTVGALAHIGPVELMFAPQVVHSSNDDFQTFSRPEPPGGPRHPLASPFHFPPESVDLPQRPGYSGSTRIDLGQSSLGVDFGPVSVGAATETLWWGPAIRNGIVMSSNAPGIPHLFLRTSQPLAVPGGELEGRFVLGRLSESEYFDFDSSNNFRSLSALALTFTPTFEPGLTVGFARAVYAAAGGGGIPFGATFDVFRNVGRPASAPGNEQLEPGSDQLFSVFGRWSFPDSGVEAYFEWARYEQPASLRDLLTSPGHSQGYTLGAQWARETLRSTSFRLQAEVTYLEPSNSIRVRPVHDWYSSRTVVQGYTHKGHVIGAGIGPGGSSQWLAGDLMGSGWYAGVYSGRIRWENQAQFTYPPEYRFADVTLFAGLRGGYDFGPFAADLQVGSGIRYNYLFQVQPDDTVDGRGVDIPNHSIVLTLSSGTPGFLR
jgi:hypothetical protein